MRYIKPHKKQLLLFKRMNKLLFLLFCLDSTCTHARVITPLNRNSRSLMTCSANKRLKKKIKEHKSFLLSWPADFSGLKRETSWTSSHGSIRIPPKSILEPLFFKPLIAERIFKEQHQRHHWHLPPSASSRQPFRHWSSLVRAPCDCSSSYSWSRKSKLLLLGNPRMVNLWDTLVHCSRLAATLSYSSAAPGNSSESSLRGEKSARWCHIPFAR